MAAAILANLACLVLLLSVLLRFLCSRERVELGLRVMTLAIGHSPSLTPAGLRLALYLARCVVEDDAPDAAATCVALFCAVHVWARLGPMANACLLVESLLGLSGVV